MKNLQMSIKVHVHVPVQYTMMTMHLLFSALAPADSHVAAVVLEMWWTEVALPETGGQSG